MSKVNVLSLQFTPIKADKVANINKVKELISRDGKNSYDLIVLPEFFDMGINLKNNEFYDYAEKESDSFILKELALLAKKYNSYIHCGSICFKENKKCYNRTYLLDREGAIVAKYDKIHLFNYFGGNEGTYTTAGEKFCVVQTDFGKIGFATCFDIRFPEMFTKLTKMGMELVVIPAAWQVFSKAPESQRKQFINNWQLMGKMRAYDNVSFVVTSNLVGHLLPMFCGVGNSMIVNFDGVVLSQAGEKEESIFAELDFEKLKKAREIFPVNTLN